MPWRAASRRAAASAASRSPSKELPAASASRLLKRVRSASANPVRIGPLPRRENASLQSRRRDVKPGIGGRRMRAIGGMLAKTAGTRHGAAAGPGSEVARRAGITAPLRDRCQQARIGARAGRPGKTRHAGRPSPDPSRKREGRCWGGGQLYFPSPACGGGRVGVRGQAARQAHRVRRPSPSPSCKREGRCRRGRSEREGDGGAAASISPPPLAGEAGWGTAAARPGKAHRARRRSPASAKEGLNKAGFGLRGACSVRSRKVGNRSTGAAVSFRIERGGFERRSTTGPNAPSCLAAVADRLALPQPAA